MSNDPNLEWYTDEKGNRVSRPRGSGDGASTPVSARHEQGAAAETGTGDPFMPAMSDFPNPGGLAGAAEQNKAYKAALARYMADPEFKKQFTAAKRKAAEEAKAEQSARTNRKGMR